MCYSDDARPPLPPVVGGGAADQGDLKLTSSDGTKFMAYFARAAKPSGAGMVVLPDVRGLHQFFKELAQRFAEAGIDSVAIDYFARTAATEDRSDSFDYMPEVQKTTPENIAADVGAAMAYLRSADGGAVKSVFTVGFCFGGRLSFVASTIGLDTAGVIGFYGWPTGPSRNGTPAPADLATSIECPVLAIWGGADQGIGPEARDAFDTAMDAAGVSHRTVTYPGAPHSFFDRKADEFADASASAWTEVMAFIGTRGA
jgi:carboxymethylenebutenolidase